MAEMKNKADMMASKFGMPKSNKAPMPGKGRPGEMMKAGKMAPGAKKNMMGKKPMMGKKDKM